MGQEKDERIAKWPRTNTLFKIPTTDIRFSEQQIDVPLISSSYEMSTASTIVILAKSPGEITPLVESYSRIIFFNNTFLASVFLGLT